MIRVLVVDDSAVLRRSLIRAIEKSADIEVVGEAGDPYEARELVLSLAPDVLTLDVEMPRMDGLTFLSRLMRHHPVPVVMLSSITAAGSPQTARALELGAAAVVRKPDSPADAARTVRELVEAIRGAARQGSPAAGAAATEFSCTDHQVLAVGASTGGTVAIESFLNQLPADVPATLIVQHMPEGFMQAFAQRLDRKCPLEVREARNGDQLRRGLALLAPAGHHMTLRGGSGDRRVVLDQGPPVHYQRPAVDNTFFSVARHVGAHAFGVLLTGMGSDGAAGLLAMRRAGAWTAAQDEESSVVFGMPGKAISLGAAVEIAPLDQLGGALYRARLRAERGARTRSG